VQWKHDSQIRNLKWKVNCQIIKENL